MSVQVPEILALPLPGSGPTSLSLSFPICEVETNDPAP